MLTPELIRVLWKSGEHAGLVFLVYLANSHM